MQSKVTHGTDRVGAPRRVEGRRPGGFEPRFLPRFQLLSRGLLQRLEEVTEARRAKLVCGKVATRSFVEGILADPGHKLLEHCRTLGVGDAVKVCLRGGDIGDIGRDGVRCRHLILCVRPDLPVHGKVGPLARVARRRCDGAGALILRE